MISVVCLEVSFVGGLCHLICIADWLYFFDGHCCQNIIGPYIYIHDYNQKAKLSNFE